MRFLTALLVLATLPATAADAPRVDQFGWLAGCWGFEMPEGGRYEEQWTKPTGNNILGVSRRVSDGFTREFEFMRIVTSGGGGFNFIAIPQNQAETAFLMSSLTGTRAVFENSEHDFPNRVIYEFVPPDSLNARIEGKSNGKPMGVNFPMKRRSCP